MKEGSPDKNGIKKLIIRRYTASCNGVIGILTEKDPEQEVFLWFA